MALTLPDAFKNRNIVQNWLFQLHYDDESAFIGTSFYDTTVTDVFYRGVVLSKPSIRESISLEQSKSRTGNVTLTLANFSYLGDDFSAELYGSRKYLNRLVKIYIQPNRATALSDCLLIYTGKLKSMSHSIDKIKLDIEAKRPWDGIEIPQVKTAKDNYYPLAYGDFTPNPASVTISTSSDADDFRSRKSLYPIPVEERRGDTLFALTGIRSTSANAFPHFYEKAIDKFLPIANHASTYTTVDTDNESYGDGYAVRFHQNMVRKALTKLSERVNSAGGWASNNNILDGEVAETSTYTEYNLSGDFTNGQSHSIKFVMPQLQGFTSLLQFHYLLSGTCTFITTSGSGQIRIKLIDDTFGGNDTLGYFEFNGAASNNTTLRASPGDSGISSVALISSGSDRDSAFLADSSGWGADWELQVVHHLQSGTLDGELDGYFRIYDVFIEAILQLDFNNTSNGGTKSDAYKFLDDLEYVYCGANGLTDNGWNSNSAITEIHEAHRDLLHRFTSYTNSNTPTNWGSGTNINSIKDWRVRYWINRPVELIKVLEKLQYEGGFIFRFNGQNAGEYIFIPDSISTDHTLGKDDLGSLDISLSDVSKVVARMDIEYRKHPATNGYQTSVSASNSTAISDLLIGTNENKKTIRLDAYVGDASGENDIPTSATSNPNDDWYSYYNQILGSQKIIVKAEVVNLAFYGIDVGDFVAFTDMPVDPFGLSWSGKDFIVTSVTRQLDKLKCEFREV